MHKEIVNSLEGAAFAHGQEFIDNEGQNDNWSLWYAHWLLHESEMNNVLSEYFTVDSLGHMLANLDGRFRHKEDSFNWCSFYATEIEKIIAE